MLTIWTGANPDLVHSVLGPVFESFDPMPDNRAVKVSEQLLIPEEGEVVLAMGTKALDLIKACGLVQRTRTVASLREKLIGAGHGRGVYLPTFDPFLTQIDTAYLPQIRWDLKLAERFHRTRTLKPTVGKYGWAEDFRYVVEYIKQEFEESGQPVEIALDLETVGLVPEFDHAWIVSISFSPAEGYSELVHFPRKAEINPELKEQISWILTTRMVSLRGANLKFDLRWIKAKWGLVCTNFKFDTLLVGSLLNENRSNSLESHAKEYTDMGGYDTEVNETYDKGRMDLVPKDKLLVYAGGDTDATLRVSKVFKSELLADKPLARFYVNLLHPAARAFERIEERGMIVDVPKYFELKQELENEIGSLETQMLNMVPHRLRIKHQDKIQAQLGSDKSPFTAGFLTEYFFTPYGLNLKPRMFTEKSKTPSTAREHLMMFKDVPEAVQFVGLLEQLTSAEKTLSTYVVGFMKHLRPDGRFHPTYMMFNGSMYGGVGDDAGTDTGRTSARDPAVQTIPKKTKWAKKIRACFPAPPGYRFFQRDFSQGELRVVACVADETNMISAYKNGMDLHCLTASGFSGRSYEEFLALEKMDSDLYEELRRGAKAGNFGLLYGMGAEGFMEYARINYGVHLTLAEATKRRDAFFALYPGLLAYHDSSKNFVRHHQYVRSPLGRIRHLPLVKSKDSFVRSGAERQAINSPIQATLSDMALWSIAIIDQQRPDIQIVGMTHDSIYGYVHEDTWEDDLNQMGDVMSNLPFESVFGWKPQLSFPSDAEIGSTMADLKKYKKAA